MPKREEASCASEAIPSESLDSRLTPGPRVRYPRCHLVGWQRDPAGKTPASEAGPLAERTRDGFGALP